MVAVLIFAAVLAAPPHREIELSRVEPSVELSQELARYGMEAYVSGNRGAKFSCLTYSPTNVSSRELPLIVYIPGSGEIGPDLTRQFNQRSLFDKVTSREFQTKHPCHLIAISPPKEATMLYGGSLGHPSMVQQMLRAIVSWYERTAKHPAVDKKRIYLVGYSYGGDGVYALATHYPGEFAAVLSIASVTPHIEYVNEAKPGNWWHIYNREDYDGFDRMFAELNAFCKRVNACGGDFRVGEYPSGGHDAWTKTWRDEQIWNWMFSKSLDARKLRLGGHSVRVPISLDGARCKASVRGKRTDCGPEQAIDGLSATCYEPRTEFGMDDWWMMELPSPVVGTLKIVFGNKYGRDIPEAAYVEVSADGREWRRLGLMKDGENKCEFVIRNRVRMIRIRPAVPHSTPFAIRSVELYSNRK